MSKVEIGPVEVSLGRLVEAVRAAVNDERISDGQFSQLMADWLRGAADAVEYRVNRVNREREATQ